jgi:hypothetical protein
VQKVLEYKIYVIYMVLSDQHGANVMQIEKDVPMPTSKGRGRPPKYPFGKMEIGDSFFVNFTGDASRCNEVVAAYQYGRQNNKAFSARKEDGGIRIWRIS